MPQIQISVDLAKAARFGLKPGDVRRAAATIMSGIEVTDIHKDRRSMASSSGRCRRSGGA